MTATVTDLAAHRERAMLEARVRELATEIATDMDELTRIGRVLNPSGDMYAPVRRALGVVS